MKRGYL